MKPSMLKMMTAVLTAAVVWAVPLQAEKIADPKDGAPGDWRLIGTTRANHTADHDTKGLLNGKADVTLFGMK